MFNRKGAKSLCAFAVKKPRAAARRNNNIASVPVEPIETVKIATRLTVKGQRPHRRSC